MRKVLYDNLLSYCKQYKDKFFLRPHLERIIADAMTIDKEVDMYKWCMDRVEYYNYTKLARYFECNKSVLLMCMSKDAFLDMLNSMHELLSYKNVEHICDYGYSNQIRQLL